MQDASKLNWALKSFPSRILEDFRYVTLQKICYLMTPKSAFFKFFPGLILFLPDYKERSSVIMFPQTLNKHLEGQLVAQMLQGIF